MDLPSSYSERHSRWAWRLATLAVLSWILMILSARPVLALGFGGRGAAVSTTGTGAAKGGGLLDGKTYELGLYLATLMGYESNYLATISHVEGAPIWALEGGAELRCRPSSRLRVFSDFSMMLRLPFAEPTFENAATADLPHGEQAKLLEALVDMPALVLYRIDRHFELSLTQHLAYERAKTPPIFFDSVLGEEGLAAGSQGKSGVGGPSALAGSGKTIVYQSVYETLRPALAYHVTPSFYVEGGVYFRAKMIDFLEIPVGSDPDYWLFDVGADLSAKYRLFGELTLRLKYDVAERVFVGLRARPPEYEPALRDGLAMTRHLLGFRIRGRLWGIFSASAGYLLRINTDNGGNFDYVEHLLGAGLGVQVRDALGASISVHYQRRGYGKRTACEAMAAPPGTAVSGGGSFIGTDCKPVGPSRLMSSPQVQSEHALLVTAALGYTLFEWMQLVATYDFEDAESNIEDVLVPNHRVMAGLSFQL